jgi:hypothetical protein
VREVPRIFRALEEVGSAQNGTQGSNWGSGADGADAVEVALAGALKGAADAGRWDVVERLARELEARRKARESPADGEVAASDCLPPAFRQAGRGVRG